jgi:hypothetical protein
MENVHKFAEYYKHVLQRRAIFLYTVTKYQFVPPISLHSVLDVLASHVLQIHTCAPFLQSLSYPYPVVLQCLEGCWPEENVAGCCVVAADASCAQLLLP